MVRWREAAAPSGASVGPGRAVARGAGARPTRPSASRWRPAGQGHGARRAPAEVRAAKRGGVRRAGVGTGVGSREHRRGAWVGTGPRSSCGRLHVRRLRPVSGRHSSRSWWVSRRGSAALSHAAAMLDVMAAVDIWGGARVRLRDHGSRPLRRRACLLRSRHWSAVSCSGAGRASSTRDARSRLTRPWSTASPPSVPATKACL